MRTDRAVIVDRQTPVKTLPSPAVGKKANWLRQRLSEPETEITHHQGCHIKSNVVD